MPAVPNVCRKIELYERRWNIAFKVFDELVTWFTCPHFDEVNFNCITHIHIHCNGWVRVIRKNQENPPNFFSSSEFAIEANLLRYITQNRQIIIWTILLYKVGHIRALNQSELIYFLRNETFSQEPHRIIRAYKNISFYSTCDSIQSGKNTVSPPLVLLLRAAKVIRRSRKNLYTNYR